MDKWGDGSAAGLLQALSLLGGSPDTARQACTSMPTLSLTTLLPESCPALTLLPLPQHSTRALFAFHVSAPISPSANLAPSRELSRTAFYRLRPQQQQRPVPISTALFAS